MKVQHIALMVLAGSGIAVSLFALREHFTPDVRSEPSADVAPARLVDPEQSKKLAELKEKAKARTSTEKRVAAELETLLGRYLASALDEASAQTFKADLVELFTRENLGSPRSRKHVARRTLEQLPEGLADNASLRASVAEPESLKRRAGKLAAYVTYVAKTESATVRAPPAISAPDGVQIVRWETIGDFEYDEGSPLPQEVLALDGKTVALSGYMDSMGEFENIREFILAETVSGCCFGTPPSLNQLVLVDMKAKAGAAYSEEPVVVVGTFRVKEEKEDEFVTGLFRLEATSVTRLR